MWSQSTQITVDFICCHFRLQRRGDKTHTQTYTEREIRDFSVALRENVIDTICPHISFYFPNACRLSPARKLAEKVQLRVRYYSFFRETGQRVRRILRGMKGCMCVCVCVCVCVCFTSYLPLHVCSL